MTLPELAKQAHDTAPPGQEWQAVVDAMKDQAAIISDLNAAFSPTLAAQEFIRQEVAL